MATHKYRLLEQGVTVAYAPFEGLAVGDEIEHDFYDQNSGLNHEQAVIAAGWVERVDAPAKEGKK